MTSLHPMYWATHLLRRAPLTATSLRSAV